MRGEFDAMRLALPDLKRLERYERRAWSRRKRAIRDFIEIKSRRERVRKRACECKQNQFQRAPNRVTPSLARSARSSRRPDSAVDCIWFTLQLTPRIWQNEPKASSLRFRMACVHFAAPSCRRSEVRNATLRAAVVLVPSLRSALTSSAGRV